jgi:hypothetical protein
MDGEAVQNIIDVAQEAKDIKEIDLNGLKLHNVVLYDNRQELALVPTLKMATLGSIVHYIQSEMDTPADQVSTQLVLHVVSPTLVKLYSPIISDKGGKPGRQCYAQAEVTPPAFPYKQWQAPEDFIIALHTLFVMPEAADDKKNQRNQLLTFVSKITGEKVTTSEDDGYTQKVTAMTSAAMRGEVAVPNPVWLRPRRTFPEVAQPASPFVLRVKDGKQGELPWLALFEVDTAWTLEAVKSIADELNKLLGETDVAGILY